MKILWRLEPFCGPCKRYFYISLLLAFLLALLSLAAAHLLNESIQTGTAAGWAGTAAAAALLFFLFRFLDVRQQKYGRFFSEVTTANLNRALSEKLKLLSVHWYDEKRRLELLSVFQKETARIQQFLAEGLSVMIRLLFLTFAGFAVLFTFSYLLGALSLSLYAAGVLAAFGTAAASGIEESLFPIWMKKPFHHRKKIYTGKMTRLPWILLALSIFGSCVFFSWSGILETGESFASILILTVMVISARELGRTFQMFLSARESINTIFNFLHSQLEEEGLKGRGELVFDGVSLSCRNGGSVRPVSFLAFPGDTIAVAGKDRKRKTAIAHLISGFLKPESGSISIDGVKVNGRYSPHSAAVVFEVSPLISGTIKSNIDFSKKEPPMSAIIQAAKTAQAHDFIMELPEQYNTAVHGDFPLSKSELQRLALARALLAAPGILVLDHALSAVDIRIADKIYKGISEFKGIRTVVLLGASADLLNRADRIYVLKSEEDMPAVEELRKNGVSFNLV